MKQPERKKPPVTAANSSNSAAKKAPPRKAITTDHEVSEPRKAPPARKKAAPAKIMTKKAPPRKPPVKKSAALCATVAELTGDVMADDIPDIRYSRSSEDKPTAPLLDSENGNWDDFVETFASPADPFDPNRDYGYVKNGQHFNPMIPVTAKNYRGYIVPRCKGMRSNKALTRQQHIALDYDKLPIGTLDTLRSVLGGVAHIVYTTASHLSKKKDGLECFRLVVPMDQPVDTTREMVAVRVALADVLARQIPALVVDRASFTPSQPMYLPVAGSKVWHCAGRSQSTGKLLAHFTAAGLSVHVAQKKEGAHVPEGIDQIFQPVMDMLIEWGATSRDDSGRMLLQANEEHAEQYSSDSKEDDFAFMFPMDGIAEVFNVAFIHGSDLDEMDQWKRHNPKRKNESVGAYMERRRLAGIQYAIDACAPDEKSRRKMTVLMDSTIEAHKSTILESASADDLAFDDEEPARGKTAQQKQAQAIVNAVKQVKSAEELDDEASDATYELKLMEDDEAPALLLAEEWLSKPALCGCVLAWDNFRSDVVFKPYGKYGHLFDRMIRTQQAGIGGWYELTDDFITKMRLALAKALPECVLQQADMSRLCDHQAKETPIDTALEWAETLQWDGVPRVDRFFVDYLGAEDTPYTRAAARSFWSGAGGRLIKPGTKQDQTIILVGKQGIAKSTAIDAMVPDVNWSGAINFDMSEAERIRRMRGKLVLELSEMAGFTGKKRDAIKTFMTATTDEMVRKYKERSERTPRRAVFIGTSNESEILHDSTGERRWLPIKATRGDKAGIEAVRDQLWAEGIALFNKHGVLWQEAQELAAPEHENFKESDTWEEAIDEYIAEQVEDWNGLIATADILIGKIGMPLERISKADEMRIAKIMRAKGYDNKLLRVAGKPVRRWVKA